MPTRSRSSLRLRARSLLTLAAFAPFAALLTAAEPESASPWPEVTRESKPWTRWWWPGSAVDKPNLQRELSDFAQAGFGGVEVTPIYGAKGYEKRFLDFLSPGYVDMLGYTAAEAGKQGLSVDMATGTGWPFGGPQVTPDDAELRIEIKEGQLQPRPTDFHVKRSAPGGQGLVLNPYSPSAMRHYLAPFDEAFKRLPDGAIHGQFHDSFEYQANWVRDLPSEFIALHGYDLREHAAELAGKGDTDAVARIKSDYRETLAKLHLNYLQTWIDWTHKQGGVARNQAHGAPGNLLDLYGAADIPETEIFGSHDFRIPGFRRDPSDVSRDAHPPLVHRFASSAAHVMGRRYASSETFTWLREHFREAPSQMKPEADMLFLTGINHLFYHGSCYSPSDAVWPGWVFYASSQVNSRNSLWEQFGWFNEYLTRAQSLLQAGEPDNELLVYWPVYDLWHRAEGWQRQLSVHANDWLMETATGRLCEKLDEKGYQYDFVSDAQLASSLVESGGIRTPGARYRAVLVPRTGHMPLETFKQLLALANGGATILFVDDLPVDVPGYARLGERRARFQSLVKPLAEGLAKNDKAGVKTLPYGKGRLVVAASVEALLAKGGITAEPAVVHGVQLLRRSLDGGALYFAANFSAKPFDGWLPLSKASDRALLLDPRTGAYGAAAVRKGASGNEVYVQLKPGESLFVKSSPRLSPSAQSWTYEKPAGAPLTLSGKWSVSFLKGGPALPPSFDTQALKSWTDQGGEAERFAGTARYELSFELPAGASAEDWLLDLGDVRETARVFVNGREIDRLWSLPYATRVGAALKPGRNTLALEVTNLSANRLRDLDKRGVAWKNFYEINFVNINYRPFDASGWSLQPSGLLGPVTLTPLHRWAP